MRATRIALLAVAGITMAAAAGDTVEFWKRFGLPGHADRFRQPQAIHADLHTGELFVCDRDNHRVVIFDENGLFRYEIPGGATFRTPLDIAVDSEGWIFLLAYVDQERTILKTDFDGRDPEPVPLRGLPDDIHPPEWTSMALSPGGDRIYLVDQANMTLWMADRAGAVVGRSDLLDAFGVEEREEQIPGRVDAYGDRVVVGMPMLGQVGLFDRDGRPVGAVGIHGTAPCQSAFPVAAAFDRDGKLWMLDRQRSVFMRWDPATEGCLEEYSGIGTLDGFLYQPSDLALDRSGRIIISQGFEGRVQAFRNAVPAKR